MSVALDLTIQARKEADQYVKNIGGNPQNGVNKKTEYLVLGDTAYSLHGKGTSTSKLKKAESLIQDGQDLNIITETDFQDMVNDQKGVNS